MRGHDVRRTGRAEVDGPLTAREAWKYRAADGVLINMEATAWKGGVYFGTWGITRREFDPNKTTWDKFDGKLFGLDSDTGRERWDPLRPAHNPYSYAYDGREPGLQDGPAGEGLHWNFYNGTIEGTAAADPATGLLYLGRGDGKLFAIDPDRGTVRWRFVTLDPARPDDPEGGGEIIGGPLVSDEGTIVFATFGAPHRPDPPERVRHETNAVYAIGRDGKMQWRYPRRGSLPAPFLAPPALSPDGQTVYAVTSLPDAEFPCECLALDIATGRLGWKLPLGLIGAHDIAVGIDGTVFCSGNEEGDRGPQPVAFAIRDLGGRGQLAWRHTLADEGAHFANGVSLLEARGKVERVYVTTTSLLGLNTIGGRLHVLDSKTGDVVRSWDPKTASTACVGGLTDVAIGRSGFLYAGVRGQKEGLFKAETRGRFYCLRDDGRRFHVVWSFEVDGQIDWASPCIGGDGGLFFGSSDRINDIARSLVFLKSHDVADADPLFYGIRDDVVAFDTWRRAHGLGASMGSDVDGDGANALGEYAYGTNPRDARSFPIGAEVVGREIALEIAPYVTGVRFVAEQSTDLEQWSAIASERIGGEIRATVGKGRAVFGRVRVVGE